MWVHSGLGTQGRELLQPGGTPGSHKGVTAPGGQPWKTKSPVVQKPALTNLVPQRESFQGFPTPASLSPYCLKT